MARHLGIVTALSPEATLVRRLFSRTIYRQVPVGALWQGRLAGLEVILLRCGMGAARATQGATWLAQHTALWGLLSVGFAGGVQPVLVTGEGIVATHIMTLGQAHGEAEYCNAKVVMPDPCLRHLATVALQQAGLEWHVGSLLHVPTIVTQATVKQRLGSLTGALAVDMESYGLGQIASQYRLAFMTLRTIFDTAAEELPFRVEAFSTPAGRFQPGRFGQYLWRHPSCLAHLPHAWWQARVAGHSLQMWLQAFVTLLAANRKDVWR